MRVAIYARVSTTDQNCEMQLRELREYAARRGWEITGEYVDTGWSGAKASRPQLDRLMRDARAHAFDAIAVWKIDRFSRSMLNLNQQLADLTSWGIRFIAITQSIDTDQTNPTSRLLMQILGAVAEFERETIRERVAAGLSNYREAHKQGRVGKERCSRSGKNLAVGRPKVVLDRVRVLEMRKKGATVREIAKAYKVGIGTVARTLAA